MPKNKTRKVTRKKPRKYPARSGRVVTQPKESDTIRAARLNMWSILGAALIAGFFGVLTVVVGIYVTELMKHQEPPKTEISTTGAAKEPPGRGVAVR